MTAHAMVATALAAVTLTGFAGVAPAWTPGTAHGRWRTAAATANVPPQKGGEKEEPLYPAIGSGHFVKSVRDEGRFVTLEDNSLWEIEPTGRYLTAAWEVQAGISIRHSGGDDGFVYEIDNVDTDDGASARWVRPAPPR